jgi:uncharacterized membrane protein YjgN (DUF898 family)
MQANQTPVKFTGKGGEYFGIWIVNLLLSIVTLGIYSAWAKVRRMKYFYNNTKIDGVGFDYHASPKSILIGRIIAFVLFVLYVALSNASPFIGGLLIFFLFLATPWIIVRSMIFNARNSSHRGLRFDFTGKKTEAAIIFIVYPILILITLGLAFPFVMQQTNKFLFENHQFGASNFKSAASIKSFYMIYLKAFGVVLALGLVFALVLPKLFGGLMTPSASLNTYQPAIVATATGSKSFAPISIQQDQDQSGFIKVAVSADAKMNAQIEKLEKYAETLPDDKREKLLKQIEMMKKNQAALAGKSGTDKDEEESEFDHADSAKAKALQQMGLAMMAKYGAATIVLGVLGVILLYGLAIAAMTAYFKSRVSNLVWNNTTLENVGFVSNMRMRDLVWLYFTNGLALLFTLGLATPWVQIRMARYKAEHLALTGETDWDKFVGEKKASAKALGGEVAEMFDMDISFG